MPGGSAISEDEEDMDVEIIGWHSSLQKSTHTPAKSKIKAVTPPLPPVSRAESQSLKGKAATSAQPTLYQIFNARLQAQKEGDKPLIDKTVKRTAAKGNSPRNTKKGLAADVIETDDSDLDLLEDDAEPTLWKMDSASTPDLANKPIVTDNMQVTPPHAATAVKAATATKAATGIKAATATKAATAIKAATANKAATAIQAATAFQAATAIKTATAFKPATATKEEQVPMKPAPIFLAKVTDIMPLLARLDEAIGQDNYTTKPAADHGLRVQCKDVTSYRALVKYLETNQVENYTFQLKSERGFRAVIRHLHHSTPDQWIRDQLLKLGHSVCFLRGIKSRFSKEPLDLFEVELVASPNNSDLLQITALGNQRVRVEKPFKSNEVAQCHRCQKFGHTKNYCRRPFICVKCGGSHPSTTCPKQKGDQTPAKCANCSGPHAASYRGCPAYKEACNKKESEGATQLSKAIINLAKTAPVSTATYSRPNLPAYRQQVVQQQQQHPQPNSNVRSYASVARTGLVNFKEPIVQAAKQSQQRQSRPKIVKDAHQPMPMPIPAPTPIRSRSLSSRRRRPISANRHQAIAWPRSTMAFNQRQVTCSLPSAPNVQIQASTSLEAKIDRLIDMIATLTTCLINRACTNDYLIPNNESGTSSGC